MAANQSSMNMVAKMAKAKIYVSTNEKGYRVGQDHPNSKLTDVEVASLIRDRGPEDNPTMSLSELAKLYGLSKSGVKGIVDGNRRCQAKRLVNKQVETKRTIRKEKVRVNLRVSLRSRAILHRLGGGAWIDQIAVRVDEILRRARTLDDSQAVERVLKDIGVMR